MMAIRDNRSRRGRWASTRALQDAGLRRFSAGIPASPARWARIVGRLRRAGQLHLLLRHRLLVGLVVGGVGWIPGAIAARLSSHSCPISLRACPRACRARVRSLLLVVIYLRPRAWRDCSGRNDPPQNQKAQGRKLHDQSHFEKISPCVAGFALSALIAASPALAQKKYDPGATDTEIKIGNIMPYSRTGLRLWRDRQDRAGLFRHDQRRGRRQRPQDHLHLL
jgi:hypothetical protein